MSGLSMLVSACRRPASVLRVLLRRRHLSVRGRTALLVSVLAASVALNGGGAAILQLPVLLAIVGCIATAHGFVLRVLSDRFIVSLTGSHRDAALLRRLQNLCSSGDFPQRHERVSDLVVFLAKKAGCSCADQKQLAVASGLHRIGLVSLPPAFLEDHGQVARRAAAMAKRLLAGSSPVHRLAIEMATCHDENWDGTGEAFGLASDAIPFSARLLHVALALDALLPRTGRLPVRSELVSIAARLDAEGGRTLDPTLARLSTLHIDGLEALLRSHLRRHSPCGLQPSWWTCTDRPYAVDGGLTPA